MAHIQRFWCYLQTDPETDPTNVSSMHSKCSGVSTPAFSLLLGNFILSRISFCTFHFHLLLPVFHLNFASRPSPSSPTLPLGLLLMPAVLCLIFFLTVQCFFVNLNQVICACLMPPGISASAVSENVVDASIELPSWSASSLREFPLPFLSWSHHFPKHGGEANDCSMAQGSVYLVSPLVPSIISLTLLVSGHGNNICLILKLSKLWPESLDILFNS